jgi:hypothetical protein
VQQPAGQLHLLAAVLEQEPQIQQVLADLEVVGMVQEDSP